MVPGRHAHRPPDAGDGAEPDRGPHPGRAGRAHDPLHLPDQCRARRHGLAAGLADLPRQVLQRRDAWPDRLRGGDRRRLQPGARRHRRRPADRRFGQPRCRVRLDGVPAGDSIDPARAGHSVSPAGPVGPPRGARRMSTRASLLIGLLLLVLLALAPVDLNDIGVPYPGLRRYGTYILTLWLVTAIAAMGVNLIVGYAGQETLAQAAFVGIGAYLTAIVTKAGVPFG